MSNFSYYGSVYGDLLHSVGFEPSDKEVRRQIFLTDEFGYRSSIGGSGNYKTVFLGTSQVVGAAVSQEETLPNLMMQKYGIESYNLGLGSGETFLNEKRFWREKSPTLVVVGTVNELLVLGYLNVDNRTRTWDEQVLSILDLGRAFSVVRKGVQTIKIGVVNHFFDREFIARYLTNDDFAYDSLTGRIYNGRLSTELNSEKYSPSQVVEATLRLGGLAKRITQKGGKMMVVIIPNRNAFFLKGINRPLTDSFATSLERRGILVVNMEQEFFDNEAYGRQIYFPDDSHWTGFANELIVKRVYEKLRL